jgi:hypothetical protein
MSADAESLRETLQHSGEFIARGMARATGGGEYDRQDRDELCLSPHAFGDEAMLSRGIASSCKPLRGKLSFAPSV